MLAALLLRPGEVVSTDRLIEAVWGEEPPRTAPASLQNAVFELRKVLGRDAVVTRPPGYALDATDGAVDAAQFERAVGAAMPLEPAQRAEALASALALWRGPALADVADEPFASLEAARLDDLRLTAFEARLDAELALGRGPDLVAELEAHVALNSLRERPRGQLMLALYRAGRQAEALEAYRAGRAALVDGLGIEPSQELQELERRILRQDPALLPDLPQAIEAGLAAQLPVRKTVSVVAVTLDDVADVDPEVLQARVARLLDALTAAAGQHGGTIDRFLGAEAVLVFGVPELHEDDALRALRAAADIRESQAVLTFLAAPPRDTTTATRGGSYAVLGAGSRPMSASRATSIA